MWFNNPVQNPVQGAVTNDGEIELNWSCFAAADSHRIDIHDGNDWVELSTYGLDTFSDKLSFTPFEVDTYRVRVTALVDGVDGEHREVGLVRRPERPRNLRGEWPLGRNETHRTEVEWDASPGATKGYEAQIYDHAISDWVDLEPGGRVFGVTHVYHSNQDTELYMTHISPRFMTSRPGTDREEIAVRVRAKSAAAISDWSVSRFLHPNLYAAKATDVSASFVATDSVRLTYRFSDETTRQGCDKHRFQRAGIQVLYRDGDQWYIIDGNRLNMPLTNITSTWANIGFIPQSVTDRQFRVRQYGRASCDGNQNGYLSPWSDVMVLNTSLEAPDGLSGEMAGAGEVNVRWNPVDDADHYYLRVWNNTNWTDIGRRDGTSNNTGRTVHGQVLVHRPSPGPVGERGSHLQMVRTPGSVQHGKVNGSGNRNNLRRSSHRERDKPGRVHSHHRGSPRVHGGDRRGRL